MGTNIFNGCTFNRSPHTQVKCEHEEKKYYKNTSRKPEASSRPPWYVKYQYIGNNDDVNRGIPTRTDPEKRKFIEEEVFEQWQERNGHEGRTLSEGLRDAFNVIKFTSNCLEDTSSYMKFYFTEHGAARTWSEFGCALPNKLLTKLRDLSGRVENEPVGDVTISSDTPSLTMLELVEEFGKVNTGNTNGLPLLPKDVWLLPKDVSLDVNTEPELGALQFPFLLKMVLESHVVLKILEYKQKSLSEDDILNNQMCKNSAIKLKELLFNAAFCPVQLSLNHIPASLQLAVTEAMQEVPEDCRLKRFTFFQAWNSDTTRLWEVLAEKWLSNLQHLGMGSKKWGSGDKLNPILKRLTQPGCSLTSLHLRNYGNRNRPNKGDPLLEDLVVLASQLETLCLEEMNLRFDVKSISKYAVKKTCTLKSLHLKNIYLYLDGLLPPADENKELLLSWRKVALNLEQLTIDDYTFPIELFSWLNLSIPNLQTLSIGPVYRMTPNNAKEFYGNQLLKALAQSSGNTIKELSLLKDFWESGSVPMLNPIREVIKRCQKMTRVHLGIRGESETSSSDTEALEIHLKLFGIVLSVPKLQNLSAIRLFNFRETFRAIANQAKKWPGNDNECSNLLPLGGLFHAIADMAKKWWGKENGCNTKTMKEDSECNTLTMHGLSNQNACDAMHVFRERNLEYRLRYVSNEEYQLWFPG